MQGGTDLRSIRTTHQRKTYKNLSSEYVLRSESDTVLMLLRATILHGKGKIFKNIYNTLQVKWCTPIKQSSQQATLVQYSGTFI